MFVIIGVLITIIYVLLGLKKPGLAVITMPIACFLFVGSALTAHDDAAIFEAIFLAVTMVLATLVAVRVSMRLTGMEEWPQRMAKLVLVSFMIFLFIFTAIIVFLTGGVLLAALLFFVTLGVITAVVLVWILKSSHVTAANVLSTIGSSMRQNLPLPMALESATSGQRGTYARTMQRIKKWLVQGYSLSEAIKRGYPTCPSYAVAMIAAAERIDQLPQAIGAIEADFVARAEERRKLKPIHPFYPLILLTVMFFIVLGLLRVVIPQFSVVLVEVFEGSLPLATRILVGTGQFVTYGIGLSGWVVLAFIALVIACLSIRVRFRPRRTEKAYLISRIGDFIKWHLPIVHWFEKNYAMVQAVELLRLSLNAGCTVNDAIANTLRLDVNNCFRKKLRKWLIKVERGYNISASARESGLGNTLAWAFDDKVNQANAPAILETLESFYRWNYSYRVNLARFIMWPCIVITIGLMVGFIAYAFFSPCMKIISVFSSAVYP
jgi:type II secretory pathway component PulF